MECLVTGNSAVNVVSRLQSRLPSSARRESGALGACSGQAPAVRVSTLSRHNVHAHNTQPQLMALEQVGLAGPRLGTLNIELP